MRLLRALPLPLGYGAEIEEWVRLILQTDDDTVNDCGLDAEVLHPDGCAANKLLNDRESLRTLAGESGATNECCEKGAASHRFNFTQKRRTANLKTIILACVLLATLALSLPTPKASLATHPIVTTGYCWYDEDGNVQCDLDPAPPDCTSDPGLCQ